MAAPFLPALAGGALLAFTAAAAPSVPTASWRQSIVAAYDSAGTLDGTLAANAAGTFATIDVAKGASRTVAWRLPARTAPTLLWFNFGSPGYSVSAYSIAIEQAADAASYPAGGAWSAVIDPYRTPAAAWTAWRPSDDSVGTLTAQGFDRGQWLYIPAGPACWVRQAITNSDAGTTVMRVRVGLFNMGVAFPQIVVTSSMSIHRTAMPAMDVIAAIQAAAPGSDPVVIVGARSGATPGNMLANQITPLAAFHPQARIWLISPGPNNYISETGVTGRPYPGGSAAGNLNTQLRNAINYLRDTSRAGYNDPRVYVSAIPYGDYDTNFPPGISAAFNVNGLANQDNGAKPYNEQVVYPILRELVPGTSWNAALDVPAVDHYTGFADNWEGILRYSLTAATPGDGVHTGTLGSPIYRRNWHPAIRHAYTGAAGLTRIEELLAEAEISGTPILAVRKTRLQALFDALPPTTSPTALANRAALQARITALQGGFAEPAGWGPVSSIAWDMWFDAGDFDRLSFNGRTPPNEGLVTSITDKSANAFVATQTTTSPSILIPVWGPKEIGGWGAFVAPNYLGTGSVASMVGGAGLPGLVDGMGDFTLVFVGSASVANLMTPFAWGISNVGLGLGQVSGGYALRLLLNNAAVITGTAPAAGKEGLPYAYVVRRAGSALQMWRQGGGSGVLTSASTPDTTATSGTAVQTGNTAMRLLARANAQNQWAGRFGLGALRKAALSNAELDNLFGYFSRRWGLA